MAMNELPESTDTTATSPPPLHHVSDLTSCLRRPNQRREEGVHVGGAAVLDPTGQVLHPGDR